MTAVFPATQRASTLPVSTQPTSTIPGLLPDRRILAVVLPHLATDRIARTRWGASWRSNGRPDTPPVVCAENRKGAMRLSALDEMAAACGLKPGQGVSEARAMCPPLDVVPADPAADGRFLEALADWCGRYTPLVALDAPDGLFLDITGCAHLLGGEDALMRDLLTRLFHLGVDARAAVAPTPGLSWANARFGAETIVPAEPDAMRAALVALPLAALRLDGKTLAGLDRVGLKRVGDIIDAPRAPLARRFGGGLLRRLDQALGLADEPVSPRLPVAALSAERRLAEPVGTVDDILYLAGRLADSLRQGLEARGQGALLLALELFRVDGKVLRLEARATRPLREPARMQALFSERLAALHDDFDAGFGFETLRLGACETAPFIAGQADFSDAGADDSGLVALAERLSARLGDEQVVMPIGLESHVPERACRLDPALERLSRMDSGEYQPVPPHDPPRPVRLFGHGEPVEVVAGVPDGPPVSFRWRKGRHRVARAEGPERIAAEWWIDGETAPTRDYYRVEDTAGRRFWLYRQGLFDRETGQPGWSLPGWFLHGVFA